MSKGPARREVRGGAGAEKPGPALGAAAPADPILPCSATRGSPSYKRPKGQSWGHATTPIPTSHTCQPSPHGWEGETMWALSGRHLAPQGCSQTLHGSSKPGPALCRQRPAGQRCPRTSAQHTSMTRCFPVSRAEHSTCGIIGIPEQSRQMPLLGGLWWHWSSLPTPQHSPSRPCSRTCPSLPENPGSQLWAGPDGDRLQPPGADPLVSGSPTDKARLRAGAPPRPPPGPGL